MRVLLPGAVEQAVQEFPDLRNSMPRQYLSYMGVMHSEDPAPPGDDESIEAAQAERLQQREMFTSHVQDLVSLVISQASPFDAAADLMAQNLMQKRLPPALAEAERKMRYHDEDAEEVQGVGEEADVEGDGAAGGTGGAGGKASGKKLLQQKVKASKKMVRKLGKTAAAQLAKLPLEVLQGTSHVRLAARDCAHLAADGNAALVTHRCVNTRSYLDTEQQTIEFDVDCAPALEHILRSYPEWLEVSSLPLDEVGLTKSEVKNEKVRLCTVLYENGVLLAK